MTRAGVRSSSSGTTLEFRTGLDLQVQHRSGTLTVGESTGFASRGGVIGFFRDGTRIRFEINRTAAREVGVRISSRLLRLAKLTETED